MTSKLLPKAVGAVAILGVAGGVSAQTPFDVTATVQNALTVVNEQDMSLGTLFAVSSNDTAYKYMVLSPTGTFGTAAGHSTVTLLSLGGQQAARGSIAVGSQQPLTVELPVVGLAAAGLSSDGTSGLAAIQTLQEDGTAVAVRLADPAAARFYLGDFRVGGVSGGSISTANCATTSECVITPSFGSTSVSFGIGATLMTDVDVTNTTGTAYQQATYTGTFNVTASY